MAYKESGSEDLHLLYVGMCDIHHIPPDLSVVLIWLEAGLIAVSGKSENIRLPGIEP
jgi:hypothetical protein